MRAAIFALALAGCATVRAPQPSPKPVESDPEPFAQRCEVLQKTGLETAALDCARRALGEARSAAELEAAARILQQTGPIPALAASARVALGGRSVDAWATVSPALRAEVFSQLVRTALVGGRVEEARSLLDEVPAGVERDVLGALVAALAADSDEGALLQAAAIAGPRAPLLRARILFAAGHFDEASVAYGSSTPVERATALVRAGRFGDAANIVGELSRTAGRDAFEPERQILALHLLAHQGPAIEARARTSQLSGAWLELMAWVETIGAERRRDPAFWLDARDSDETPPPLRSALRSDREVQRVAWIEEQVRREEAIAGSNDAALLQHFSEAKAELQRRRLGSSARAAMRVVERLDAAIRQVEAIGAALANGTPTLEAAPLRAEWRREIAEELIDEPMSPEPQLR